MLKSVAMNTQHPLRALQQRINKAMNGEPIAPPMTEDDIEALRQRNTSRTKAAIAALGPRWVGRTMALTPKTVRVYNAIADQRPEWVGA